MTTPRLTLYNYWRSSSSYRVRIALGLKGLPYEYAVVDVSRDEHASDAHRARSPTGYVPCLVVDGVAYVESVAIVELLEDLVPEPRLYPARPHDRARVRALVEIVNSGTQPLHNRAIDRHVAAITGDEGASKRWNQHFIARGLASLERALAAAAAEGVAGPYAYGAAPTAADVFLVPQVYAATRFGVPLDPFPRVGAAYAAATALESVQKAAPDKQPDSPR